MPHIAASVTTRALRLRVAVRYGMPRLEILRSPIGVHCGAGPGRRRAAFALSEEREGRSIRPSARPVPLLYAVGLRCPVSDAPRLPAVRADLLHVLRAPPIRLSAALRPSPGRSGTTIEPST